MSRQMIANARFLLISDGIATLGTTEAISIQSVLDKAQVCWNIF